MIIFDSAQIYIESKTSLKAKITAIDQIITALMSAALKAGPNDDIAEYTLNDGQTQIRTAYRGAESVFRSINTFERLKQMYINRFNGRMVRLMDGKNFC